MRISDWSSDVCSSDLTPEPLAAAGAILVIRRIVRAVAWLLRASVITAAAIMLVCITIQVVMRYVFGQTPSWSEETAVLMFAWTTLGGLALGIHEGFHVRLTLALDPLPGAGRIWAERGIRSEEHTSELQSLMRISYAV